MNILITGTCNGVGKYLKAFLSKNNTIYSFNRDNLDITNKSDTFDTIIKLKPDMVIHTDSMNNIDTCEFNESEAYTINTIGTLNVAYPCNTLNIPIIYTSSSYVYGDSKDTPFYETDECNPVNIYGKTKLAGEKLIKTICKKYFILRVGWIFGTDDCFVKKVLKNKDVPVFVCTDEIGNTTYVKDLAEFTEILLTSNLYGIYNCANTSSVNKSIWVKTILNNYGIEKSILELPQNFVSNRASRPKYSAMNTSLLTNCFNKTLPSWEESLNEYMRDFINN